MHLQASKEEDPTASELDLEDGLASVAAMVLPFPRSAGNVLSSRCPATCRADDACVFIECRHGREYAPWDWIGNPVACHWACVNVVEAGVSGGLQKGALSLCRMTRVQEARAPSSYINIPPDERSFFEEAGACAMLPEIWQGAVFRLALAHSSCTGELRHWLYKVLGFRV